MKEVSEQSSVVPKFEVLKFERTKKKGVKIEQKDRKVDENNCLFQFSFPSRHSLFSLSLSFLQRESLDLHLRTKHVIL